MRRYLTKTDPQTDGAMAVWKTAKGELQRGKGVDDNRWE